MSVHSKMTAIADEIRELSGTTDAMGLDAMASNLGEANTEVANQNELIADIVAALEGKAAGGGIKLPTLANEGTAEDLLFGKELINEEGKIITGSMPNNGVITSTMDGIETKVVLIPEGYTSGGTVSLDNTIDEEVSEQSDLIAQIKNVANNLPEAGSGSGGSIETWTGIIEGGWLLGTEWSVSFTDATMSIQTIVVAPMTEETITIPINTIIYVHECGNIDYRNINILGSTISDGNYLAGQIACVPTSDNFHLTLT